MAAFRTRSDCFKGTTFGVEVVPEVRSSKHVLLLPQEETELLLTAMVLFKSPSVLSEKDTD
jgi:hypothetical protein